MPWLMIQWLYWGYKYGVKILYPVVVDLPSTLLDSNEEELQVYIDPSATTAEPPCLVYIEFYMCFPPSRGIFMLKFKLVVS